jgi:hypothetical protein
MPVKKIKRPPFKLSGGGYISRLGGGQAMQPVPIGQQMDSIPSLGIEYKAVERALPPDLASVPIKLKAESAAKADEMQVKLQDELKDFTAKNKLKPHFADLLMRKIKSINDEVQSHMTEDAMYYSNPNAVRDLRNKMGRALNGEDAARYIQESLNVDEARRMHESNKTLTDIYINPHTNKPVFNPSLGRVMTNSDYYDMLSKTTSADPIFREISGITDEDEVGTFGMNPNIGTMDHATKDLNNLLGLIKPDATATETDEIMEAQLSPNDYTTYMQQVRKSSSGESNAKAIDRAKEFLAKSWQSRMSAEGVNGLRQAATKEWLAQSEVIDGKTITVAELVKQIGQWTPQMQQQLDDYIQKYGEEYTAKYLGVAKYNRQTSSTTRQLHELNTTAKGGGSGGLGADGLGDDSLSYAVDEDFNVTADTNDWDGNHGASIKLGRYAAVQPKDGGEVVEQLNLNGGEYWVLGDAAWYENSKTGPIAGWTGRSTSADGQPKNSPLELRTENDGDRVVHLKTATVLVATGKTRDPKTNKVVTGPSAKTIVVQGDATNTNTKSKKEVLQDEYGKYVTDENDNKVYVQDQAAAIYRYGDKTIIKAYNRMDSLVKFGKNYTGQKARETWVKQNGGGLVEQAEGYINLLKNSIPPKALPVVATDFAKLKEGAKPTKEINKTALYLYRVEQMENFLNTKKKGDMLQMAGSNELVPYEAVKEKMEELLNDLADQQDLATHKSITPAFKPTVTISQEELAKKRRQ